MSELTRRRERNALLQAALDSLDKHLEQVCQRARDGGDDGGGYCPGEAKQVVDDMDALRRLLIEGMNTARRLHSEAMAKEEEARFIERERKLHGYPPEVLPTKESP